MKAGITAEDIRVFREKKFEVYRLFRELYGSCVEKYGTAVVSAALFRFVNWDFDVLVRLLPSEADESFKDFYDDVR